jgi:transcriptional regulator GlxA family with amidase domain
MTNLKPSMITYQFAIIQYPNCLLSAVFGFDEMFSLTNRLCQESSLSVQIHSDILDLNSLDTGKHYHAVLIPPSMEKSAYESDSPILVNWLNDQYKHGAILSSACAGAFFLAATIAVQNRCLTTHWGLAETFKERFPEQALDASKILIDHGDIISAGGMVSWMDLGVAIIQRFTQASIVRQLGKTLVMDTGMREQRYYQQFTPRFDHGDNAILAVQHYLQNHFTSTNRIIELANIAHLTPRTFLRRFHKYTYCKPSDYIQRLRIQAACNLLEETTLPFESIALNVGYEDAGSCRKTFRKVMGLTPIEFRKRFAFSSEIGKET